MEIKSYRDKAFLDELKEIKIGEWRNSYTTERFGYTIYDGTQWELEIYYCNAKGPIRFSGSNSYPYNFNKFLELLKEVE
ncbi:hypothetical protein H9L01_03610 [Erysipelothrix inopinata]|uniref:Uncharacterized protein n=1 Tax=Erysipelothrix inopinata TaxID=225084 RepID=A0A7G9S1T2_9FIRM|nr:hypothetical protein H9L01_03610 [Erysipelothrix inopinata]